MGANLLFHIWMRLQVLAYNYDCRVSGYVSINKYKIALILIHLTWTLAWTSLSIQMTIKLLKFVDANRNCIIAMGFTYNFHIVIYALLARICISIWLLFFITYALIYIIVLWNAVIHTCNCAYTYIRYPNCTVGIYLTSDKSWSKYLKREIYHDDKH